MFGEFRDYGASRDAVGSDSNVTSLHGSRAPHGVAQVTIISQVASQGLELSMSIIMRIWRCIDYLPLLPSTMYALYHHVCNPAVQHMTSVCVFG
jgi:hypothetical protein